MAEPIAEKILLIGWDAADWNVINPLMDRGEMPRLESLVNAGVMGNLATLYPELSPMLWTSIATGKRAYKHGIYGFSEPDPSGRGVQPVTNLSRKTKAIWNILSQKDKKCNVLGWWPSHPAEPINGVMVSNHYQRPHAPLNRPWPMMPGTVHPERLIYNLKALRWHPQALEEGHILPFVPNAAMVDQDKDRRLETIARIICDCSTIQAAALALMHHEPWDFTAVYFDAIDHFSHGFMRYHPPRLDWVSKRDFHIYNRVVESGYIYHDMLLGKLLEEAGKDTTVILISDHGFHSDHRRPKYVPIEPAGPAIEHRRHGIFVMKGAGIKEDEIIFGAGLLDICPTILTLFGLPVGKDMDGVPLVNAFKREPAVHAIVSWDEVAGNAGLHPPLKRLDPMESRAALKQLVELGYIEEPDDDGERAVKETIRELDYNLARAYMDTQRHLDALGILEELSSRWPEDYRFSLKRADCLQALGRLGEARRVIETTLAQRKKMAARAFEELKEFSRKQESSPVENLSGPEQRRLRKLRRDAAYDPAAMEYMMGSLILVEGEAEAALKHLFRAETAGLRNPNLFLRIGEAHLKHKRLKKARQAFNQALLLDPENALVHLGLCRFLLATRQNNDAAEQALKAVALSYHYPLAHFLLGVALHRLSRLPEAVQALKIAVSQNPNFPEAYGRLAYIYRKRLNDPEKALAYEKMAAEAVSRLKSLKKLKEAPTVETLSMPSAKDIHPEKIDGSGPLTPAPFPPDDLSRTVVVVSGFPRSGTSMMMQMLNAGGLPVLTDGRRKGDEDNPKGYFELDSVKTLQKENSWLKEATGRAVKVVAQLLAHLNYQCRYRIIYMERNIEEVVRSQEKMLSRQGKEKASISTERMIHTFARQEKGIKRMLASGKQEVLYIPYHRCIHNPKKIAKKVNGFLGGSLDETAMANAVVPDLYRNRHSDDPHPETLISKTEKREAS
ncbi:MAG: alkaline phosphatase family protein [Deltaproteobacteria bacterium]|nr:alkaline phosphatase family protein [Deltaproteobacteria bacterium]